MKQIVITIKEHEISPMTGEILYDCGDEITRVFNIDDRIRFINPTSNPSKEVKIRLLEELIDYLRNN